MPRRVVGRCTPGCGACCRLLALPVPSERAVRKARGAVILPLPAELDENWCRFLVARGVRARGRWALVPYVDGPEAIRFGEYAGGKVAYVQSICRQLDERGMCRLFGQPERPAICQAWPSPFDDLSAVADRCTYRIVEAPEG